MSTSIGTRAAQRVDAFLGTSMMIDASKRPELLGESPSNYRAIVAGRRSCTVDKVHGWLQTMSEATSWKLILLIDGDDVQIDFPEARGGRFRMRMLTAGRSAADAAAVTGMSPERLREVEAGSPLLPAERQLLSPVLGLPPADLRRLVKPPPAPPLDLKQVRTAAFQSRFARMFQQRLAAREDLPRAVQWATPIRIDQLPEQRTIDRSASWTNALMGMFADWAAEAGWCWGERALALEAVPGNYWLSTSTMRNSHEREFQWDMAFCSRKQPTARGGGSWADWLAGHSETHEGGCWVAIESEWGGIGGWDDDFIDENVVDYRKLLDCPAPLRIFLHSLPPAGTQRETLDAVLEALTRDHRRRDAGPVLCIGFANCAWSALFRAQPPRLVWR